MKRTGRTILIAGGGSGIGLAPARALLARGNTVVTGGKSPDGTGNVSAAQPTITPSAGVGAKLVPGAQGCYPFAAASGGRKP
jgi:short-subunit dehydrogenase involved in D-alanine esterification of teichoic acids